MMRSGSGLFVLPKQVPTGDQLPGPRSHGLPGRTAQQIPGAWAWKMVEVCLEEEVRELWKLESTDKRTY